MHLVIVYENTGSGHKKLAKILREYLTKEGVRITLTTTSHLLEEKRNLFSDHWNVLLRSSWIYLADVWLNFFSRVILLPFYYSLYDKAMFRGLDKLKPDMVISTADVNRLIGSYCKHKNIPFFVFISEGVIFVDMLHHHATHVTYFHETEQAVKHTPKTRYFKQDITPSTTWIKRIYDITYLLFRYTVGYVKTPYLLHYRENLKINNDLKTKIMGPLREKVFYMKKESDTIKKQYDIAEDEYCILVSNGGLGGNIIPKIINSIKNKYVDTHKLNLIAVCGSDQMLYAKICGIQSTPKIRITPLPSLKSLADLYHIADCSIGRGTAGILMDSVVSQTPMIVLKKVTTNDYGTLDIIKKYKIGEIADSIEHIPNILNQVLQKKDQYQVALKKLFDAYENDDSTHIERALKTIVFENDENSEVHEIA